MFSNREYADMILIYGEAHQNANLAAQIYSERFPQRIHSFRTTIVQVYQRVLETRCVQPRNINRGPGRHITVEQEERILEIAEENPGITTRSLGREVNISHSIIHRTLRENLLYPYHHQRVQALLPEDFPRRLVFCQWFLQKNNENHQFLGSILVTDECTFTRDGILNFHNTHTWSQENPHTIHEAHFQQRFKINIWAGILGDNVIGPFELPPNLTGPAYLNFLSQNLPQLLEDTLEDLPLQQRLNLWFLHDGAPPHIFGGVVEHLNTNYPNRWIGRNAPEPRKWPARSPDLNPLDFWYWGDLKQLVYGDGEIQTEAQLRDKIFNSAELIRHRRRVLRVRENWVRRSEACVESGGRHFEQLI